MLVQFGNNWTKKFLYFYVLVIFSTLIMAMKSIKICCSVCRTGLFVLLGSLCFLLVLL